MWICPGCSTENTDSAGTCHRCATPRGLPNPDAPPVLNYATTGRRYAAILLKFVPVFAISTAAMVYAIRGGDSLPGFLQYDVRSGTTVWVVVTVVLYVASLILSIQFFGQTFGKLLLGLRVVNKSGAPATNLKKMLYELVSPFSLDLRLRCDMMRWKDRCPIWADRWIGTAMLYGDPPGFPDAPDPDPPTIPTPKASASLLASPNSPTPPHPVCYRNLVRR